MWAASMNLLMMAAYMDIKVSILYDRLKPLSNDVRLNLLFEWVKTGHISRKEFGALVDLLFERK